MTQRIRLRFLADVNPPTPAFDRVPGNQLITFMPLETVWADSRLDLTRTRSRDDVSSGYVRFQQGDILSPKVTPTFQAGRSAYIQSLPTRVGAASTEVHVIRPNFAVADGRYIRYGLMSKGFLDGGVSQFQGMAGLQRVPDSYLRDIVLVPDLVEQRRIADFLDDQVARIGSATRLRASSADAAWDLYRATVDEAISSFGATIPLKYLAAIPIVNGLGLSGSFTDDSWPRYIRTTDIGGPRRLREDVFASQPREVARRAIVQRGDILMTAAGAHDRQKLPHN